jgi:hypothetical protein
MSEVNWTGRRVFTLDRETFFWSRACCSHLGFGASFAITNYVISLRIFNILFSSLCTFKPHHCKTKRDVLQITHFDLGQFTYYNYLITISTMRLDHLLNLIYLTRPKAILLFRFMYSPASLKLASVTRASKWLWILKPTRRAYQRARK